MGNGEMGKGGNEIRASNYCSLAEIGIYSSRLLRDRFYASLGKFSYIKRSSYSFNIWSDMVDEQLGDVPTPVEPPQPPPAAPPPCQF